MTPQELFASQYRRWFESVFSRTRVSQGASLDPFATSLRRTGVMVDRLGEIRATGVPGGDANQVVTDLSSAGLVERKIGPTGAAIAGEADLSSLGARLLEEWESLGIAETTELYELARAVALVRIGVESEHVTYLNFYDFWNQLVSLQPADYWLQDGWRLYAPSYLNQTDDAGFNPFSVICVLRKGDVWSPDAWLAWAGADQKLAPHITKFVDRVPTTRLAGRRNFCRAMEIYRLHALGCSRAQLESVLMSWRES
ncbi:hypothetical protein SAMN04489806_1130 [Paramicrobacterium humi]|uniref:Uncharacterized protein n=1 Tax=Paramicrobacterium humi TaxID=640635 RepID=A0A1H4KEB2_9MICO|nr:hypothetical protein [Microbacterium humi]SEB56787.1 hypothetical protein SAMN04489806_1130 [Microbacterium humi]